MTHRVSNQPTGSGLRLAEVVAAMSLATDLGSGHPLERSLRACLLAFHFGAALGLDEAALRDVYYVTLPPCLPCSTTSSENSAFAR